ncbi:MAG: HEAT repeat domain-containing protein [Burkholderiales bacterium]|nr:HEAT repeat domain-containing protein [Anaerolineae bacterium]
MKHLKAVDILELLETEDYDLWQLRRDAPIKELIQALQTATNPEARDSICYVLGKRYAKSAAPAIIECLSDEDERVRHSAAEALGSIRNPIAGEPLMRLFLNTYDDPGTQNWCASALGAVGYRPAIPYLIEALKSPNFWVCGASAWSLGYLRVVVAEDALREALAQATDWYPKTRILEALDLIKTAKEQT